MSVLYLDLKDENILFLDKKCSNLVNLFETNLTSSATPFALSESFLLRPLHIEKTE